MYFLGVQLCGYVHGPFTRHGSISLERWITAVVMRHENPSYVTVLAFLGALGMLNNYSDPFKSLLAVPSINLPSYYFWN